MMQLIFSLDEIDIAAEYVLAAVPHKIILFNGEMGAGKTTLIKAISSRLGVADATCSPTFSLVNEYEANEGKVYHFDMYRLKSPFEALDMGIEEYLYSGHWCFIEWAEKISDLIPDNHSVVNISALEDGSRQLTIDNW